MGQSRLTERRHGMSPRATTPMPAGTPTRPAALPPAPTTKGAGAHTYWLRRSLLGTVLACALMLVLSGCGNDKPEPIPAVTTTPPTSTAPSWESAYTQEQIEAYDGALNHYSSYLKNTWPIYEAGEATDEAKTTLRQYWGAWQTPWFQLLAYKDNPIKYSGPAPHVVSAKALSVKITTDGAGVNLQACVDRSNVTASQGGKTLATPSTATTRGLVNVALTEQGGSWLIWKEDGVKGSTC